VGESKIDQILCSTFINITEHVAGVRFTQTDDHPADGEHYVIKSEMKGNLMGDIAFFFPKSFADKIVETAKIELDDISYEDILKEYVNILFGRMLSCASNFLGKYARFSPPEVTLSKDPEVEIVNGFYTEKKSYCFNSDSGNVYFRASYTIK